MSAAQNLAPRAGLLHRLRSRPLMLGAAAAIALLAVTALAASALWIGSARVSGGTVRSGDLALTAGVGTWQQITPGVTDRASGALTDSTDGFLAMPGDVIELRLPVTATMTGDNLDVALSVSAGSGSRAPIEAGELAATFRVVDAAGAPVVPVEGEAQLDTPLDLAGLKTSAQSVDWTVVVTVRVLGDYRWSGDEFGEPALWSLGGIDVALQQVRSATNEVEGGAR